MKLASFGVIAALFVARAALVQDEVVRLDFDAGGGCPGRPEFMAEVRARTERVRFVDAPPDAGVAVRELKVTAGPEGDRAVGRLRVGSAEDADRLVTGKTCADVISALALIAALAIDPAASQGAIRSPVAVALPASSPSLDQNAEPVPPPPSPPPDVANPSARESRAPALPWIGATGARGELSRGFGAEAFTLVGASVYGEAGLAFRETWRPVVRLSALAAFSPTVEPNAQPGVGAANMRLLAGRLAACPLEYRVRPGFRVRPCASFELGRLDAFAKQVPNGSVTDAGQGHMARVAVGESVEAHVRLAAPLWMDVELGLREPLLRQRFVFMTPDVVAVSSVSAVEIAGGLGLAVHFP